MVHKWCGSGAEAVQRRCGSGAEAVRKRCRGGAEAVQKRCGSGAEAVHMGGRDIASLRDNSGAARLTDTSAWLRVKLANVTCRVPRLEIAPP